MLSLMKLYHISKDNLDGLTFYPRIPRHVMKGENITTSRICVSTNISGCIRGEGTGLTYYYVHVPDGNAVYYNPGIKNVPDVKETREKWIVNPVKMKCIGLIDTSGTTEKKIRWKWVRKFNKFN